MDDIELIQECGIKRVHALKKFSHLIAKDCFHIKISFMHLRSSSYFLSSSYLCMVNRIFFRNLVFKIEIDLHVLK